MFKTESMGYNFADKSSYSSNITIANSTKHTLPGLKDLKRMDSEFRKSKSQKHF